MAIIGVCLLLFATIDLVLFRTCLTAIPLTPDQRCRLANASQTNPIAQSASHTTARQLSNDPNSHNKSKRPLMIRV